MQKTYATWIDNAKFAAIVAVVLLHVSAMTLNESPPSGPTWWLSAVINAASRWGVPVFVTLSGAALLGLGHAEPAPVFYRKRLARVLIPLLFWSLFYVLWAALLTAAKGQEVDWAYRLIRWTQGRPYYHLWFLYMVLGLYLITPWLRLAMRDMSVTSMRHGTVVLFIITATDGLWRGLGWSSGQDFFLLWCLSYLPYFLLGGLLARRHGAAELGHAGWWWLAVLAALAVIGLGHAWLARQGTSLPWARAWAGYWLDNNSLPVILLSLALLPLLLRWQRPLFGPIWTPRIATLSFGIYLIHPAVLDGLRITRLQQLPLSWPAAFGLLMTGTLVALVLSLGIALLISRLPYLRRVV